MKKLFICAGFALAVACTASPAVSETEECLKFDAPARTWLEALPLGNSHMGAMVFGGVGCEEIQLNEEHFWSGGPHSNNSGTSLEHLDEVRSLIFEDREEEAQEIIDREFVKGPHGMRFLNPGSLLLDFGEQGEPENYSRRLDLATAVNTTEYTVDGINVKRTAFASIPQKVVVLNIDTDKPVSFSAGFKSQLQYEVSSETNTLTVKVKGVEQEGIPAAVDAEIKAVFKTDGKVEADSCALRITDATETMVLVSAATNFINWHDVSGNASEVNDKILAAAGKLGFKELLKRHTAAYSEQYGRVSINLPTDERAALLFNYGRYLLISSSQPGGEPANLQGVWNRDLFAPWDSKYTININTEMNYWPAEVCGLTECEEPLFELIRDLSETGAVTAREMYGCRGWVAHHNTDIWRIAGPVDGAFWGMYPNGGAWLATHLWQHYLFTLDKDFLKEWYPVLKGAADFYLDYMQVDPRNGYLVIVPSVSPEHGGAGKVSPVTAGCTMDNQIAFDALSSVAKASEILGIDAEYRDSLNAAIAKLPPMKVGQYGQLQEWVEDMDDPTDQHRHISHLYGLYPSNQIDPVTTPELFEAARVTLIQRGDMATGWSLGWKMNFWARMKDGNHAYLILDNLFKHNLYPNWFDAHPPFQIDGNFGAAAGIAEMLLQSQGDAVELLPALPDAWSEGQARGLRARGGFIVDMEWKDGAITSAVIRSTAGGSLKVRCGGKEYSFETRKGQTVKI